MLLWLEQNLWWVTPLSLGLFLLGLLIMFILAINLPANYFLTLPSKRFRHPLVHLSYRIIKNIAGLILLTLGLIMAMPLIPGPGLLLILLGLSLIDLPLKHKLELYLLQKPLVLNPLNKLRIKFNKPPLLVPKPNDPPTNK